MQDTVLNQGVVTAQARRQCNATSLDEAVEVGLVESGETKVSAKSTPSYLQLEGIVQSRATNDRSHRV